ncbi:MAG: VPLPA-CTERM sorting domain-containing protein, partial [Gammaproteobacteria bacterium]
FNLERTPYYGSVGRNQIDAPPPQYSEFNVDGTTIANVLTSYGSSLFVTFDSSITAFGVDLASFNDGLIRTEIVINGVVTTPVVQGAFDVRFFGFISSDGFTTVEFRGIENDGFGMDNVLYGSGTAVPIPAAVWLFGSALAGLGWMRRKQTV